MSTALFVGKGQGGAVAPSCPTFEEQIKSLELRDAERAQRRLERLEKAASEASPLSCQRGNISRNSTYYNRVAVALETNIARWILSIGKRYSPQAIIEKADNIGLTPYIVKAIEAKAKEHVAELTITMPHTANEDLRLARSRFASAWNEFNRRVLKERFSDIFGEFVRVFEAHKDGVLHAHIIIECKRSLRRGSMAHKWKPNGNVDGATVADWVRDIWRQFRAGEFSRYGIGERHTLQPIRKGVKQFSRYIAKYIGKNVSQRPEHLKGLRSVAYSQGFLSGVRLMAYDYDKSERITYFSKTANAWKWRYRRFTSFDVECASRRVRRLKIKAICCYFHLSFAEFKRRIGSRWGFLTRRLVSSWGVGGFYGFNVSDFEHLSKWEKFAYVRNWLGDAFKAVIQFDNGKICQYDDFKKMDAAEKTKRDFSVCGFLDGGIFRPIKAVANGLKTLLLRDFTRIKTALKMGAARLVSVYPIEQKSAAKKEHKRKESKLIDYFNRKYAGKVFPITFKEVAI